MSLIVIDPGHGGARPDGIPGIDHGVSCENAVESAIAAHYSAEIAAALERLGVDTHLTRAGADDSLTLGGRCQIANQRGAAGFISVHCNASPDPRANGFQAFHCAGSQRGEALAWAIYHRVVPSVSTMTDRTGVLPDASIHCGYTRRAAIRAEQLRKHEPSLDWRERDAKVRAEFGSRTYRTLAVLRQTRMPAVLLELDFVTSSVGRLRLHDEKLRRRMAAAVAEGVCCWLQGERQREAKR